jgi:hypothetical protein
MKELSLNILDIAQNSLRAGATIVEILLDESDTVLKMTVRDNGCGMSPEFLARVTDPFSTTRTTRRVGLGLPFLRMEAEMTGGSLEIQSKTLEASPEGHGTTVTATFCKSHIDFIPLGNIIDTLCTLIQGACDVDFTFVHRMPLREVTLSTKEMREILGEVPLNAAEVLAWVREYLTDAYATPPTDS